MNVSREGSEGNVVDAHDWGRLADRVNLAGVVAFWILVAVIVGARVTLFHPDTFASFQVAPAAGSEPR